jgi:50S ribosomal protein L16 3-hydroxylase
MADILGGLTRQEFLDSHWQRQPLLIRQAVPDYSAPLSADELAVLALQEEVESRIVLEQGELGPWELRLGPFLEKDFQQLPATHWTLLVQAVDLWVPEVARLLERFDFLPRWRVDDIMASYAPPGGSVGPHFDLYDVFLLQVEGQRRWQIGGQCAAPVATLAGTDLDILAEFEPLEEWLLEPGDMLYLPPRVPHWGVAVSDCMTFSIGFRAPSLADMLADLAVEVAAAPTTEHYRDPPLTTGMAREDIDPAFMTQLRHQLSSLLQDETLLADWFARYMTQPKLPGLEDVTGEHRRARIGGRDYENGEPV